MMETAAILVVARLMIEDTVVHSSVFCERVAFRVSSLRLTFASALDFTRAETKLALPPFMLWVVPVIPG